MGLDTVELLMGFEDAFGIMIPDEDAARLRTPRMVMDYVAARLPVEAAGHCVTQRTFYRLRRGIRANAATVVRVRPATPLRALVDRRDWPALWTRIRASADEARWPESVPWKGFLRDGPETTGELATWITMHLAEPDRARGGPWTREEIELTLRRVVRDTVGIERFALDDEFVRDMRLD